MNNGNNSNNNGGLNPGASGMVMSSSFVQEHPLMMGFTNLKGLLASHLDSLTPQKKDSLSALTVITPFLDVIRSGSTTGKTSLFFLLSSLFLVMTFSAFIFTGPIAGGALFSIEKFLHFGLLDSLPDVAPAMIAIATSVTHCKFEATDAVSDEVVLMKILEVLKACLTCSSGTYLSDEAVCQMMETCFSMCFQMRLSEVLRKLAEQTLIVMVQTLFNRLQFLEDEKTTAMAGHVSHMDGDISRGKETGNGQHSDDSGSSADPSLGGEPDQVEPNPQEEGTESPLSYIPQTKHNLPPLPPSIPP